MGSHETKPRLQVKLRVWSAPGLPTAVVLPVACQFSPKAPSHPMQLGCAWREAAPAFAKATMSDPHYSSAAGVLHGTQRIHLKRLHLYVKSNTQMTFGPFAILQYTQ